LTEIVQIDIQKAKIDHETVKNLDNLARDLQPLQPAESEKFKRMKAVSSARPDAEKHQKEPANVEQVVEQITQTHSEGASCL
jgi:hypothetical protein